jgi:Ran GTPase-activating protein (RanGAP) involved in mRNA processing and transport
MLKSQLRNEVANFNGCDITQQGVNYIAQIIRSNQISQNEKIVYKFKKLILTNCGIGNEAFSILAKSLHNADNITSLDLSQNLISDGAYFDILNLMKNNSSLTYLNLAGNKISQDIVENIINEKNKLNSEIILEIL